MSDTVFRSSAPQESTPIVEPKRGSEPVFESKVDVPYLDYSKQKGHSYVLDYYDLGHLTNRGDIYDASMYDNEVNTIEAYLEHQIGRGDVNNTTESVKNEIKRIEKLVNVKSDARSSMRLQLVSEYAKFLLKAEGIKVQAAKYGLV